MPNKNHLYESLKKIPYLDEKFLTEIKNIDWFNPAAFLNKLDRFKWPPINMLETDSEIIVSVFIPGLKQASDVRLELKGSTLRAEGEIPPQYNASPDIKVHTEEVGHGQFSRTVNLPGTVQNTGAIATYQHGVLEIRLKKLPDVYNKSLNVQFR